MLEDEEPFSDKERILLKLDSIEGSLQRIVEQEDKSAMNLKPILDQLASISRAIWLVVWIGVGGIVFALLRALRNF